LACHLGVHHKPRTRGGDAEHNLVWGVPLIRSNSVKRPGGGGGQQLFHKGPQQYQEKPKTDTGVGSREPDSLKRT